MQGPNTGLFGVFQRLETGPPQGQLMLHLWRLLAGVLRLGSSPKWNSVELIYD